MKNILLAAAIALGSISATIPETQAATTVTITDHGVRVKERHARPHHRVRCRTKTVRIYRNHKLIVKKTRVCR